METFGIGGVAGLVAACIGLVWVTVRRVKRRLAARAAGKAPAGRLEALAAAQADLAARVEALAAQGAAPEERMQAMAGQLLGLIRDKNATMETALAGLDQLRARMRALEQMGEPAEARALMERLEGRLDELASTQAAGAAALEARIAGIETPGAAAELAGRLAALHEKKDAGFEAIVARLGTLEADRATTAAGREALRRVEARVEALAAEQGTAKAELAALKATGGEARALAAPLAKLHEQKEALAEAVLARLGALEAGLAAQDPRTALAPLEARLAAVEAGGPFAELSGRLAELHEKKDAGIEATLARLGPLEARLAAAEGALGRLDPRLTALETGPEPFTAIAEQLTRLYAQKDAVMEAVLERLAGIEAGQGERDPAPALARLEARLEGLRERLAAIEAPGTPFAAISEQLTRLYAQKDATVETVFARLAPLEARLAELEGSLGRMDPREALDRFAERLEETRSTLQSRIEDLASEENPFAAISEQLTRLYAQKDATVETVFARLAPLEARLAELEGSLGRMDPREALDRFAERLEETRSTLQSRIEDLASEENPFAAISEQLTRLYAQKDATVETVFARLAPLEARLAELEGSLGRMDPREALDRFAERLEETRSTLQSRIEDLASEENPFAAISEQLTRLYAQKDATVETVFARLAPLEARLAELEGSLGRMDPREALDRFAERLEETRSTLQSRIEDLASEENPFAAISEQLTRLYAQKDATVETVFARLAPLEARLAELEGSLGRMDPREALDRFAERLEETRSTLQSRIEDLASEENPFAAISEQLTRLYAQKDATVETVFARLAPLEARLAELEGSLGRMDPREALDRFAERLEETRSTLQSRIEDLASEENPFAAISEQLTRLYAQKDATVETVFARLAPLEARLAELEGELGRLAPLEAQLAAADPAAALDGVAARLEAVAWEQGELAAGLAALKAAGEEGAAIPLAGIAEELSQLRAQWDVGVEAALARLAPLEARIAAIEEQSDPDAAAARAEAQTIAAQIVAAHAAAEQTALFSDRLALLEASLPRPTARRPALAEAAAEPGEEPAPPADALEAIWTLPRIVSLHRK